MKTLLTILHVCLTILLFALFAGAFAEAAKARQETQVLTYVVGRISGKSSDELRQLFKEAGESLSQK